MAADIPLKVRVGIRDLWDSKNSSIHKPIEDLKKTLGHTITPLAQWPALWVEIGPHFADKDTFVPTIVSTTIVWYERLLARLEENEEWTEDLLTVLTEAGTGGIDLRIEPAPGKVNRPTTFWDRKVHVFHLGIPKAEPISQSRVAAFLEKDLENLFAPGGAAADDVDWADVPPASAPRPGPARGPTDSRLSPVIPAVPDRLPGLGALARPSDHFPSAPPYILTVMMSGREGMVVQCSHEPSLDLLHEYLKKWGKTNPNDSMRRPIFKLTLVESDFCIGLVDSLYIEPNMTYHKTTNPTLILSFIESVLGYTMVKTHSGSYWMYRRTTLLKK